MVPRGHDRRAGRRLPPGGAVQLAERPDAPVDRGAERRLALVAMAMTFAIISRHIDLSPGSMLALSGAVMGIVYRDTAASPSPARRARRMHRLWRRERHPRLGSRPERDHGHARRLHLGARTGLGLTHGNPIVVDTRLPAITNHTVGGFTIVAPIVVVASSLGWFVLSATRLRPLHVRDGRRPGGRPPGGDPRRRSTPPSCSS